MNSTSPPRPHGVVAGRGINVRLAGQWDTTLERGTVPPKVGRLAGMGLGSSFFMVASSSKGSEYGFCMSCNMHLLCSKGGIRDLKLHGETE